MVRIGSLPSEQPYEALFIDDREDGTADAIRAMTASVGYDVLLIRRPADERNGALVVSVVPGPGQARGGWMRVVTVRRPPRPDAVLRGCDFADGGSHVRLFSPRSSGDENRSHDRFAL